jgi:drug/metabolite transporter (DMT)-like permease
MDLLLLLGLGTIWGSSYLFIKVAIADIPVLTLVAGRLLLAAIILWSLLRILRRPMPRSHSLWGAYAFMGFFSGTLPWALISWGEQYIPSSLAALLQATMPMFTVIMAFCLAGEEPLAAPGCASPLLGTVGDHRILGQLRWCSGLCP